MCKVIADVWMTLDGVVQSPSYPDEDVTGGFGHGGWHTRYLDEVSMNWVIENVRGAGGYLLGRGTYEIFAAHWPDAPEEQQVLAGPLNALPKYVASTTLGEPLGWRNSRLLRGDIGAAVCALKAEGGKAWKDRDIDKAADDFMLLFAGAIALAQVYHDPHPIRQAIASAKRLLA